MDNRYHYTREKLGRAIEIMATGAGDVRERLLDAFMEFHTLGQNDFPPELYPKWEWVMNELTKYGPTYNYKNEIDKGSVEHTMQRIKRKTGEKIAREIYMLNYEIHNNEKYL